MGRLYLNRVYLAGPMDRALDGGMQWRQELTPWLNSRGIVVLDPTNKPCDIGIETPESRKYRRDAMAQGNIQPMLDDKPVRQVDLRMVDISDFLIVNMDMEQRPAGTMEEIMLANREKKPVLLMCPKGKYTAPDWLYWTFPPQFFFSSWDEIKEYIDYINDAQLDEVDTLKRWVFFRLQPIYDAAVSAFAAANPGS
jgi:nucleoside 2-deoxyribosyltransferase